VIVAFCRSSVVLSVSRIIHEHVYGCRPNMVGMGKGERRLNFGVEC